METPAQNHESSGHDQKHHAHGVWSRLRHALTPHSHDHSESIITAQESSSYGIRAAWISLAGMAATAIMQIVIVALSGSMALLADTLHNVGHLVTTIPLIIAFRLGRRAATSRYPYGYRRAEDLVGLLISAVIALSAALIIWESLRSLMNPRPLTNLGWVLAAGIVGALGNEAVAWYRIRAGRRIGSAALIAEGNHARADGLTSLAVVFGVIGIWMGYPASDAIIGLVIAVAILWVLVVSTRTVVRRLMDGVDDGTVETIREVATGMPGVRSVGDVRARWSGHRLQAQLDIAVDPQLSVVSAHAIVQQVHHQLIHSVPHLDHAGIHVDPAGLPDAHTLTDHHAASG